MKQQQAGVQALSQRVSDLEKLAIDQGKRLDSLLTIVEKQSEQLNKLVDVPRETYSAQFDRWPNAR